jgi:hypothetical protein
MKKFLISPIFLFLILCSGETGIFAQEIIPSKDFITVKMVIKNESFKQEWSVPIQESFQGSGLKGGGFATVDCIGCPLTSEYKFYAFAETVNQNQARVSITVEFVNRKDCNLSDKIFLISRRKQTKLKLKCGIEIIAYYKNKSI